LGGARGGMEALPEPLCEVLLVGDQRRGEELLAGHEPVEDGGGAGAGPPGDIGDPRVREPALDDHLGGCVEDLRLPHVVDRRPRTHWPRALIAGFIRSPPLLTRKLNRRSTYPRQPGRASDSNVWFLSRAARP